MCGAYVAMLAAEGPHAAAKAKQWLAAADGRILLCGVGGGVDLLAERCRQRVRLAARKEEDADSAAVLDPERFAHGVSRAAPAACIKSKRKRSSTRGACQTPEE